MTELKDLRDQEWFVEAQSRLRSLMFRLRECWEKITPNHRQLATGAIYGLWRAASRIFDDETGRLVEHSEKDALFLLDDLTKATARFYDDTRWRKWSGGYYINNAVYRISELLHGPGHARSYDSAKSLREAWNDALADLESYMRHASDPHGAETIRMKRQRPK